MLMGTCGFWIPDIAGSTPAFPTNFKQEECWFSTWVHIPSYVGSIPTPVSTCLFAARYPSGMEPDC